jgi:Lon protease-like protein
MSLHVFEDRYQEMMRDCLDSGTSFGVVAIRDGEEVGGSARAREVGTLARIAHVERLDDGRMNLLITGATRFRVTRRVDGKPYARGEIEYLPEEDGDVPAGLQSALARGFEGYLRSLTRVSRGVTDIPELPPQPEILAYLVAATLETTLDSRQQLLEAAGAAERMEMELRILRREEDLLNRHVLPTNVVPRAFSRN